jgi:hypothetical protein
LVRAFGGSWERDILKAVVVVSFAMSERASKEVPDWAETEQADELVWLKESHNLAVLWATAHTGYCVLIGDFNTQSVRSHRVPGNERGVFGLEKGEKSVPNGQRRGARGLKLTRWPERGRTRSAR